MEKINENKITALLLLYKEHAIKENYDSLYKAILEYAYNFPTRLALKNSMYNGDFLLYVESYIPNIITNFNYYGNPFESYLYTTLKGKFYSFIKQYKSKEYQHSNFLDYSCYKFLEIPNYTYETEVLYATKDESLFQEISAIEDLIHKIKRNKRFKHQALFKRIWIYVLKYSPLFNDSSIINIAKKIDISSELCISTLYALKKARLTIIDKKMFYENKCIREFSNYISKAKYFYDVQGKISITELQLLEEQLEKLKLKFRSRRDKLNAMNFCISNAELSKVLGMSKGSLDSAVFHFHKIYKKLINGEGKLDN